MTAFWVVLGAMVLLLGAMLGYIGWRDRHRLSSGDDSRADRSARAAVDRQAADATTRTGRLEGDVHTS